MRKYTKKFGILFLMLLSVLVMGACTPEDTTNEEDVFLEAIEVNMETVDAYYQVGEFRVDGIELILLFSDDYSSSVRLSESMLRTDVNAIEETGSVQVDVQYANLTTSFDIVLTMGEVIESIALFESSYDPYALIDTFDVTDLVLEVRYSDDSIDYITVEEEMISGADLVKLSLEGIHDITVMYGEQEVTFRMAMFDALPEAVDDVLLEELIFYEVMDMLMTNHYKNPSEQLLFEGALEGMIDVLEDPFTNYFDAEEAAQYQGGFEENYVGIGVRVQFIEEKIIVEGVINGGAAEEEGMMVGDIIRTVDGEEVTGQNLYEVVNKILGEEGTYVNVGVERVGVSTLIVFHLERRVIDNPTVVATTLERDGLLYGLITVNTFGDETADLFANAIHTLESQNIEGMIIDLRNNGGGRLFTVIMMLNEFLLNDGAPIFSLEFLSGGELLVEDVYSSLSTVKSYDIVTLINGGSASASEVFASAMQEHGGYSVIGSTSFGKGTMQSSLAVSVTEGDVLNITIGKWITADGNWVHYQGGTDGVEPDVESLLLPIETAWKILLEEDEVMMYDTVSVRNSNLQVILNGMGYDVRTDGYYDINTMQAIEEIQASNDLDVTGNVDQATMVIINQFLREYQNNVDNDSQLNSALDYLTE